MRPAQDSPPEATPPYEDEFITQVRFSLEKKTLAGEFDTIALDQRFRNCLGNDTTASEQIRASVALRKEMEVQHAERDSEFRQLQQRQDRKLSLFRGRLMWRSGFLHSRYWQQSRGEEIHTTGGHSDGSSEEGAVSSSSEMSERPSILQ